MNKKLFKTLLTSAIVLGSVATPVAAFAQDYDAMISESEAQIENLSAAQAQLYARLAVSYAKLQEVQDQAATLQGNIQENDAAIATLQAEIKDLEVAIGKRETLLADQARAVQATGGADNYVNVVASSKSVSDFVGRVDVVKKMVSANKTLLAQQKSDKEAVENKKAAVETAKADNVAKQVELEALKGALSEEQANNEVVYNQLTSDLSLAQNTREALIAEKAAYQERQAAIAAAQQAEAERVAAAQAQAEAEAEAQRQAQLAAQPAAEEQAPVAPTETEGTPEVTSEVVEETAEETTQDQTPETTEVEEQAEAPVQEEAPQAPAEETTPVAPAEETVEEPTPAPVSAEETVEVPAPVEEVPVEEPVAAAPAASTYGDVLATAAKYVGTPYVWGGKSPSGFDCSGFVQYVFREAYGIDVGGWTVPQESAGTHISVGEAQAGDLYFWGSPGSTYHVAIATGGGGYIHASQPGTPLGYNNVQNYTPTFAVRVR